MDNWDEVRTAYQVARMGTVSGAADVLGVHHATVIRHIDALEIRLGAHLVPIVHDALLLKIYLCKSSHKL